MLGGLSLTIKQVIVMVATKTSLASMNSLNSKRGNRVLGIAQIQKKWRKNSGELLTFIGVQHLEKVDPSPRRAMEVTCSVPEGTVLSVAMLTVESADKALMTASVVVRSGTQLTSAIRKEVRLDVTLSLGLIRRMQQQQRLLRGTGTRPLCLGRSTIIHLMWS